MVAEEASVKYRRTALFVMSTVLMAGALLAQVTPNDEKVPCRDYKDVLALFDRLEYTPDAWQAGIREVPRVYLETVPEKWGKTGSKEAAVIEKKRIFFRILAPIVLRINELIAVDRTRAKEIMEKRLAGEGVSFEDQTWLTETAVRYRVIKSPADRFDSDLFPELLLRIDVVPPSLSLAQAAIESGWGTSRFASEGSSLFGQWSWGKGMKPAEQRTESHGDHRMAAFGSTGEAAYAYALNLNTGDAYRDFRLKRSELRRQNLRISGNVLAETLIHYSERGQAYVDDVKTLIRQNQLDPVDDAYLSDMAVIHIVEADDTSK